MLPPCPDSSGRAMDRRAVLRGSRAGRQEMPQATLEPVPEMLSVIGRSVASGSLVTCLSLSGLWRVKDVVPSLANHSVIPILDAILEPATDRWSSTPRRVPLRTCMLMPPDTQA